MDIFSNPENYVYLIPALPGIAFFVITIGLCIHRPLFMRLGSYISIVAIGTGTVISTFILIKLVSGGYAEQHNYLRPWAFDYLTVGNLKIHLGIALDGVSIFTTFMVTWVACLIQIYSTGYMQGDAYYGRYFAQHSLFVFSMLTMVLSDNLLSFFIAWELMGLCSYLLIGFFFYKHSAADAQKKAFIVTKIGDIGMLLGILLLGALVLKAGVEHPPEGEPNPMTGEAPVAKVDRYAIGNISFTFSDAGYEALRVKDTEIAEISHELEDEELPELEKARLNKELRVLKNEKNEMLLAYLDSNKPVQQYFKLFNDALDEAESFRGRLLRKYLLREEFITRYQPYIIAILTDPHRRTLGPKGTLIIPEPGTDGWKEFCESLKTDSRYLVQVQGWPEFKGKTEDEAFANWAAFLDEMKQVRPHQLTSKELEKLRDNLDTTINGEMDRLTNPNPLPGALPHNPLKLIMAQFYKDKLDELEKAKAADAPKALSALIRELAFIAPGEAELLSGLFYGQAEVHLKGDGDIYPNAPYAASFRKYGRRLGDFAVMAGVGMPATWKDYSMLRRNIDREVEKYSFRPVPIREVVEQYDWGRHTWLLTLAALLLFCGAVGKSAQVPLHVWLPDAMEGPTPVSALIHAATMVAAGVYMVGRFYFLFDAAPGALIVVAYIGAITAFMAATIGLVLYDIKRVLAYSTISQLGYMMIGLGVGSITAGLFHLLAHAYFKALLFLGSGSVIHGSGTQDMREMGGLARKMKWTYITFLAGTLALCGIFPFAGFWSKDEVLGAAFNWATHGNPVNIIVFLLGVGGAFLTSFYMFRLISLTFLGKYRGENHVHESPPSMLIPLIILAIFATLFGLLGMPFHHSINVIGKFIHWGIGHHAFSAGTALLMIISLGIALAGLIAGLRLLSWRNPFKERLKVRYAGLYRALCYKYYFDEVYNDGVVVAVLFLCKVMRIIDTYIVDGTVNAAAWLTVKLAWLKGRIDLFVVDGLVNLAGWVVEGLSRMIRPLQSGYVQNAMFVVVIFILAILLAVLINVTPAVPQG